MFVFGLSNRIIRSLKSKAKFKPKFRFQHSQDVFVAILRIITLYQLPPIEPIIIRKCDDMNENKSMKSVQKKS